MSYVGRGRDLSLDENIKNMKQIFYYAFIFKFIDIIRDFNIIFKCFIIKDYVFKVSFMFFNAVDAGFNNIRRIINISIPILPDFIGFRRLGQRDIFFFNLTDIGFKVPFAEVSFQDSS